jgi:hypothetical protein
MAPAAARSTFPIPGGRRDGPGAPCRGLPGRPVVSRPTPGALGSLRPPASLLGHAPRLPSRLELALLLHRPYEDRDDGARCAKRREQRGRVVSAQVAPKPQQGGVKLLATALHGWYAGGGTRGAGYAVDVGRVITRKVASLYQKSQANGYGRSAGFDRQILGAAAPPPFPSHCHTAAGAQNRPHWRSYSQLLEAGARRRPAAGRFKIAPGSSPAQQNPWLLRAARAFPPSRLTP